MPDIDRELCPPYVGARAFALTLAAPNTGLHAFQPFEVLVDYKATLPEGPCLPFELLITGPSPTSFRRRIFSLIVPTSITITPVEGGLHTIVLREVGHNLWRGSIEVQVEGDQIISPTA
jgi:hypothetical protein